MLNETFYAFESSDVLLCPSPVIQRLSLNFQPFTYAVCLNELGNEIVHKYVGQVKIFPDSEAAKSVNWQISENTRTFKKGGKSWQTFHSAGPIQTYYGSQ